MKAVARRRFCSDRGATAPDAIIEPIQGEGGDNHFRPEFLQALRAICDEHDIMLIFDESRRGCA
jgi:L-lysine 6-transaminase